MEATISSIPASTCSHRRIVFDTGHILVVSPEDVQNLRPESFSELREHVLVVVRHMYKERRAAGRTHAQAVNDLVGRKVYV